MYRYQWDGHLLSAGVSPYAHPVDSPLLDRLSTPQRALVNHDWMASPYLPVAQFYYAAVAAVAPGSTLAFQIAATLLDLLTGLIVIDLLHRLGLPMTYALIYLWNPLVIVEFAHGAHVDSLMICLMMASLWALVARGSRVGSAVALAAATLTKGIPGLLVPLLLRRWGWKGALAYGIAIVTAILPFAPGAGLGLGGNLDGVGLFGAFRINASRWNYNSGLYHWLEIALSGYPTAGAVPPEVVGEAPIQAPKAIVAAAMAFVLLVTWLRARRPRGSVHLLRLALVPLGGYLLLTTTVHPWYVTVAVPLLPFLLDRPGQKPRFAAFLFPWLAFAALVPLSYLNNLDPANLREYSAVRLTEYVPLYVLLAWAARKASGEAGAPARG